MSTYLGQPLGYKSADTQTDRQTIPPKILLKISNLRGWHICAIWHPDFLWNRCVSLKIGKTKIQFLEKKLGPAVKLIYYRKKPKFISKNFILYFPIARLTHLCHVASRLSLNRCASLEIGTAKNPISGNMSVCSCFCRKIIWSHKNFQGIGKEVDCFSKAFQRTW